MKAISSDDDRYTILFDRFEYLLGLAAFAASGFGWGPLGAFRERHHDQALYDSMQGADLGNRVARVRLE